jgi:hypothetical protein
MEAAFDPGDDDHPAREDTGQRLNDFLALFSFGARSGLEPALKKTGIAFEEMQRYQGHLDREENPVNPRLPITYRPSGQKEHQRHNDLKPDDARDGLLCEILHVIQGPSPTGLALSV